MTNNDIIAAVVEDVAGHDVLPLIEVLKGKKNVSEFTIAEELKEEINTIRNKLYRLYGSNLVEFTRKKDMKKGWYIYYWTFVPSRIPRLLRGIKKRKLDKLRERLVAEQRGHFFECSNKCMRLVFDKAMDFEFKCPECGLLMNQQDNSKRIEHLLKEITTLEKEIEIEPFVVIEEPLEEFEEVVEIEEQKKEKIIVKKESKKEKYISKNFKINIKTSNSTRKRK